MNKILALLLLLAAPLAQAANIPFTETLQNALNTNGAVLDSGSSGLGLMRVARVVYDFASDAGTSGTTITPAKTAILPPKSIVTNITGYIDTVFTGAVGAKTRLLCGSTEIDPQRSYRTSLAGTTFQQTTAVDCGSSQATIKVLNTDAAVTAGKATYFISYFVKD